MLWGKILFSFIEGEKKEESEYLTQIPKAHLSTSLKLDAAYRRK